MIPEETKTDTYHIDTSNILFIFSGAFVGLDQIVKRRVAKGVGIGVFFNGLLLMLSKSIGFTANISSESDDPGGSMSFFTPNNSVERSPSNVLEQVQPGGEFPCLAPSSALVYTPSRPSEIWVGQTAVSETHSLLKHTFRLIPEFISRMPSITTLSPLTVTDLRRILTEVKGSLVSQYTALFACSGVEIKFTNAALCAICRRAVERGGGARGLRGLMVPTSSIYCLQLLTKYP
jgi:ATP-dependent Clp protease ATP-binding subunit ClpX